MLTRELVTHDYFYPPAPFNDDATYNANPRGFPATTTGRANWRRDNINLFIQRVNSELTAKKPWVKFGVSPSGIYRNGVANGGSATTGSEHYTAVFADSKKWLQEGWVDYIAPQVYWHIGFSVADYAKLIPWWDANAFGRHIYIGMASYKVNMTFGTTGTGPVEQAAWRILTQYPDQLRLNKLPQYPNILGEIHFRALFLMANALGHTDSMRLNIYRRPALLPVMEWRDQTPPQAPNNLVAAKQANNTYLLNWSNPSITNNEMDKVRQFVIYRSESPIIDINDTANLLAITNTNATTFTDVTNAGNKTFYYVVTAVDRMYNESAPSNVTDYLPPSISCPADRTISLNGNCKIVVPDFTNAVVVSDDVSPSSEIQLKQTPAAGTELSGVGRYTITLTATDASGKSSNCTVGIITEDKMPPVIGQVTADPMFIFPPNHKMREVNLTYQVSDNCGPVNTVLSVTSNEPETGKEKDWEVIDNKRLRLRAERKGNGNGREYYVTITAKDASGNTSIAMVTITVPHDQSGAITLQENILPKAALAGQKNLHLRLLKNPSESYFKVLITSSTDEPLQYRVVDHLNRLVESKNGLGSNTTLAIGNKYLPGIYYLEVIQGNEKQTIKLTKL